ncbi:hypothetical protein Ddye_007781 [Dipteronia dyeriana]|uniref:Exostosin GT47 domain-containing protein n=1 Tax=Dipteronia dyeriana TaxID=168575 RepID=A0AAD9XL14_9ROSI|nr:hypothetical protein Ddye_007781 [Dipteronia dyeriana]
MGHKFRSLCLGETRRLLWLTGITLAVIITFQYIELPYDNVLSSLFSAGNVPVAQKGSSAAESPSPSSGNVGNVTLYDGFSSTSTYPVHEMVNDTRTSEVVVTDPNDELVSRGNDEDWDTDMESSTEKSEELNKNYTVDIVREANNEPTSEKGREKEKNFTQESDGMSGSLDGSALSPPVLPLINLSPNTTLQVTNIESPVISVDSNTSVEKDATPTFDQTEKSGQLQSNFSTLDENSSVDRVPKKKKEPERPTPDVYSIADMNQMLLQSHASYRSMRPRWPSAVDQELLSVRSQIESAPILTNNDHELYAPLYRNVSMFKRSYELMENTLKVYVYKDGQKPVFHLPVLKGIYASEGWFMKLLESNKKFVTKDWRKAHLFYLPFSSRMLEETLYVVNSHSHKNLIAYLKNYLDTIATKYHFWNRTEGADHFLVACHDWAPSETKQYMANCIRALCNSDVKEGFVFGKDISLPETYVRVPQSTLRGLGGKRPSKRSILAFYAGNMHGYLRPILLQHWGDNKDPAMKIFGQMPKVKGNKNYIQHMKSSKYCICPKGYEVNSPRVVEAIFYECVPVIISDNFVPPFFEILNWESFSIFVAEKDIPNLKNILLSIPEKRFRKMQMMVKKVQQHFLWNARPVKYDLFHMILHSVWFNRVFLAMA